MQIVYWCDLEIIANITTLLVCGVVFMHIGVWIYMHLLHLEYF